MSTSKLSYDSPAYLGYFGIDQKNYTDRISWYETNYSQILNLDEQRRTEVEIDYTLSLFQVGRYHQYIAQSETLIQHVIAENIYLFDGADIFQKLLFHKAASHYNINELEESNHILLELCKINPANRDYYSFASKVIRQKSYRQFDTLKGLALGLILLSLIIIIFEILMVRTLLLDFVEPVEWSRNALLISSFLLLAYNELRIKRHIRNTISSN